MSKGGKYVVLTKFLAESGQERIHMTFSELEKLCGLPPSAYRWPSCWANSSETSLSQGWLQAGYISDTYDLQQQTVLFAHDPKSAKYYLSRPAQRKKDRLAYERYCRTHAALAETIDVLPLLLSGSRFCQSTLADPDGRYRAWERCYTAFCTHRKSTAPETVQLLALHLAWYLASWGMLRNSFLLQKDYTVHLPAVRLLLNSCWEPLWSLTRRDLIGGRFADTVVELADSLRQIYQDTAGATPSDTLLSKIILGSIGCCPAYDRYFKWAVRKTRAASPTFSTQSLKELGRLYAVQWDRLEPLRSQCSQSGTEYPPMKLLDMCFFQYGLEHDGDT